MGSLTTHKISFICFLDLLAASLIVPLMSNYLRNDIHLSNFLIGIISSTFSLLQIVSAPVVGYLSDLCGRKTILLSCLLICAVSYFLLGLFQHIAVIILVRVVLGVFKHTQVICKAYISDICEDSSKAFSQLMTITFLGFFIGPSLGGHVIGYENGFFYVCTIAAGIFVVNFVYAYCVVYDGKRKKGTTPAAVDEVSHAQGNTPASVNEVFNEQLLAAGDVNEVSNGHLLAAEDVNEVSNEHLLAARDVNAEIEKNSDEVGVSDREMVLDSETLTRSSFLSYMKDTFSIEWSHYWSIFLIKFLYALSMSLFYSNYISVLTHNFGSSSQVTGYTVSFQGFVGSVSNMFVRIENKNSYSSLYYSFILLSISVLALYACANLYLLVVLLIPLSIASSLIRVLCINITMATGKQDNRNGNISGIYNSLTSVAKVITPILGGLVTDWTQDNYKTTFLVSFVFAVVATVFCKLVLIQERDRDTQKEKED
uniref:Major facilitator superfamily domain-containing protein 9 n=1 Tax=Cacopsylla melanoneura TaxID=428564 RepID=A0A8D8VEP9_9HEMI